MSTDQVRSRAEQRRELILNVSRDLFIEKGFHLTGVAQIAAVSGVKVAQIYRDFSSKEEIIAAIVFRDLSQFLDEPSLKRAIEANRRDAIRCWILAFVAHEQDVDAHCLIPEIVAESARNSRIAGLQEKMSSRIRDVLATALAAWAPDSPANARIALADLILTLSAGLSQSIVTERQQGRDYQPLCQHLQAIVSRELIALAGV